MNLEEYIKDSLGVWVSPKTCRLGDKLQIISDMVFEETEFYGKKVIQCTLTVINQTLGREMRLRLNKTNAKNLAETYSINSQNWIGKTLNIAYKTRYNNGKEGFLYNPT